MTYSGIGKEERESYRGAGLISDAKGPYTENSMSQKDSSPVTGVIEESLVILDFGKYEGKSVEEVARLDPDFYEKLASEKENGVFAIRRQRDKTFRLYVNPLSNMDH